LLYKLWPGFHIIIFNEGKKQKPKWGSSGN